MLMDYRPDSAGSLMDPMVTTFHSDTTVEQALSRVRGLFPRRVFDVFLVDADGVLTAAVGLQDIATAKPGTRLSELARTDVPRIRDTATREEVSEVVETHRIPSLPIVDFSDRIVGVIRYANLMHAMESEASADIQTMVGVSREERALSSVGFVVRKRLPWLQINLATAFIAAAVVGLFEETIAGFTALAVLLPVVAGQSGNTGAQALAVIMRGLSLREITPRHAGRVLVKEVSVAFINGLAVAVVSGAGVLVWSGSAGLAGVTAVAMVLSMGCAGLVGAAIPLMLQILGQDPAQASSIILTTVTDVTGFFSFLGLATVFSSML
jgi:magnesium transporter